MVFGFVFFGFSLVCDVADSRIRSQISLIFIYLWSLLSMYLRYMICTKTLTNPRENHVGVPGKLLSFSMLEVFSVLRIRPVVSQVLVWGLCSNWYVYFCSLCSILFSNAVSSESGKACF